MKIAVFTETYVPYINGVVTHVKSLVDGLKALGQEVLVVCADPSSRRQKQQDGVLYCPAISFKRFYDYGVAPPLTKNRAEAIAEFAPDVVHIHQEFGIGFSGLQFAKRNNIPLVYTLHTMYDEYIYYIAPGRIVPIIKKPIHKYAKYIAKNAAEITGPSAKVSEFLRGCGVNRHVHVISNPVETDLFDRSRVSAGSREDVRSHFGFAKGDTVLAFCGRLGTEKNVHTLLEFWAAGLKRHKHIKLFIIGGGPAKDALEAQANALGLEHCVRFAGVVGHTELPPFLAAADGYVTASTSDTNSISMLEGMSMGLPVFHIHDPLNKGQVTEGENGFIYNGAEELEQKVVSWAKLPPKERQKISDRTREGVQKFGSDTLAKNLLNVYEKALAK